MTNLSPTPEQRMVCQVILEAEYLAKTQDTTRVDSDLLAREFQQLCAGVVLQKNQPLVMAIPNSSKKLMLNVKSILLTSLESKSSKESGIGVMNANAACTFERAEGSSLNLTGKSKGRAAVQTSVINPDWDFDKMGIGGLDNEFSAIFRRAFASRVFPPDIIQQLGMKHVRGILLHGPPGTGKTLLARQIGNMLNARPPKIVNGPQILDKYVGESEANIRKLFAEADEEEKRLGPNSGLHIIIFDEIDAICKQRGSMAGGTPVHDTVVNQLLSKLDGVDQLNNVLVIGMTNRKDMIDDALLRPGRLEVHCEIGLPDESGRQHILKIHTAKLKDNEKLGGDVDLRELAKRTENFSGAELEGLVRTATATAMNRLIQTKGGVHVDTDASEKLQVYKSDFDNALENDCKPAFGRAADALEGLLTNGIVNWGPPVARALEDCHMLMKQAKFSDKTPLVSALLEGPPSSGKTALAAHIAKNAGFPFVKVLAPSDVVGYNEPAKIHHIKRVFDDAIRSPLSIILLDDIERLIDYSPLGQRYSNTVLQGVMVLLKRPPPPGHRLFVLATTSKRELLHELDLLSSFTAIIHVSNLSAPEQAVKALKEMELFDSKQCQEFTQKTMGRKLWIGIRKLIASAEMARQAEHDYEVATKLIGLLEDDQALGLPNC